MPPSTRSGPRVGPIDKRRSNDHPPSSGHALGDEMRDEGVRAQRQMRAMLLDGTDGEEEGRVRPNLMPGLHPRHPLQLARTLILGQAALLVAHNP
jgi:hypothetical protein